MISQKILSFFFSLKNEFSYSYFNYATEYQMKILSFFSLTSEFSHSYFNYVTITSCWGIREITRFNITICKFARESLGSYKTYPS